MHVPVTTTFSIEGYRITAYQGIVRGIIVRAPTIVQGLLGGLKNIIGGQFAKTVSRHADVDASYKLADAGKRVVHELGPVTSPWHAAHALCRGVKKNYSAAVRRGFSATAGWRCRTSRRNCPV